MPEQQASISDLAAWNASVTKANTPGELARQREELRHYEPLALAANASVSPSQLRENYQWVAETGGIESYRNQETGRHLHIDAEAIARAYADRPAGSIIVSPDNVSRRAINEQVRQELQKRGALAKDETPLPTLIPRNEMTGADRAWASAYHVGDVLRYARGSRDLSIERGSYATVTGVDQDNNRLTVETRSGASIRYDPRRLQGISAYQEITRNFSKGDRIQFTAPNKELDVANRAMATIVGIEGHHVTARLDGDGTRHVTFDSREMRHFDHGYAVTSHSSQGVTAERVLANMDTRANPELINTRFAYVAVSRASQDAQIFTNDAEALGHRLSRDVTKSSAIDFRQAHKADQALERAATPANTQKMDTSIGFGL